MSGRSRRRPRSERADALTFFEELTPSAPDVGRYTSADRYRDFRAVFMDGSATAEQARRVLWQLFEETRLFRTPIDAHDPYLTYARIGKQEIGRWLLSVLTTPPAAEAEAPSDAARQA